MLKIEWHKAESRIYEVVKEDIDYDLPSEFANDLNEPLGSFPPAISFTEVGDYFTGRYIEKEIIKIKNRKEAREALQYFFLIPDNVKVMIWGSGVLDQKMRHASFNDQLFIGYVGLIDVGQPQPAKNFIVHRLGISR